MRTHSWAPLRRHTQTSGRATRQSLALQRVLNERMFAGSAVELASRMIARHASPRFRVAVGVNAHVVNLAASDPRFAALLEGADELYADGQSMVWAGRVLDMPILERIATTDLAPILVERAAATRTRVYFLGGAEGVAEEAARRLREQFPGAAIRAHHGYLDEATTEAVLADIRAWRTQMLFVGLGDPLQLEWLAAHRDRLGSVTALTCGGLFDWLSGRNRRAPRWMILSGLEWLYRLTIEPGRLWRRYLVGNPLFILGLVVARLSARRTAPYAWSRGAVPTPPPQGPGRGYDGAEGPDVGRTDAIGVDASALDFDLDVDELHAHEGAAAADRRR